jgi:GT2 family glycosyltransferase
MPETNRLSVTAIIPVHDGGEDFLRCLQALEQAEPPASEIIVVADGDTTDSGELAEAYADKVLATASRSGPAHARNLGALEAQSDILLFLDADILVRPETVGQVMDLVQKEPGLAAAFGSYDSSPGSANFFSQYKNLFHHYVHQTADVDASTFWSGCGAVRRSIFLDLGGFDESYCRPLIEDIEFGHRLKRAGYAIRVCKTLQVKHLKRWGAISLLKSDFFDRALPWTELILSRRWFVNDLNLKSSSRLSVILTYVLLLSLAAAFWWPPSLLVSAVAATLLLALNLSLYFFFLRERGLWFALRTIPCHWLYFAYSGLAFTVGAVRYLFFPRNGGGRKNKTMERAG